MAEDYKLAVIITAQDKASKAIKKLSGGLGNLDKQSKKAKVSTGAIGKDLKALGKSAMAGVASIAAVGFAMKKAFDLGKEGAAIQQTEESFEGLLDRIGAAPDLLDDLRSASRGTVSDLELMASTTTLLAGAQGELATQLAAATPELMEIAKAANKLNPTLGDTTFLYQSLATGIKRASPLILDNLGLTIRIGEANERYAESLGKTVDQLSAEEQKLALLNEARRAGKVLIDQAGGAAESATDDFERLEATIENVSNAFKKSLAPAIADAATALLDWIGISEKEQAAIDRSKELAETQAKTADEYARIVRDRLILEGMLEGETRKAMEGRLAVMKDGNIAILGFAAQAIAAQRKFVGGYIATNKRLGLSTKELEKRYDELTQQLEDHAAGVIELDWATTELGAVEKEQRDTVEALIESYYRLGPRVSMTTEEFEQQAEQARADAAALEALSEEARGLGEGIHTLGPKLEYAIDREAALERVALRAADAQQTLNDRFSELAVVVRGDVGRAIENYEDQRSRLLGQSADIRQAIRAEEAALEELGGRRWFGTLPGTLEDLRGDLVGIEEEMHSLGPAGDRTQSAEQRMRELEVAALETTEAIGKTEGQIAAIAGTNAAWDEHQAKLMELRGELRGAGDDMDILAEQHRQAMNQIIFDMTVARIQAGEFGDAGADLAVSLAEGLGLVDEDTAAVWRDINKSVNTLDPLGGNLGVVADDILAITSAYSGIQTPAEKAGAAVMSSVGNLENWAMASEIMLGAAYDEATTSITEKAGIVTDEIDTMQIAIDELVEPKYEMLIDIKDRDLIIESVATLESMTRYLEGTHTIGFKIKASGEWPGGGPPGGTGEPPPSGAGGGGPSAPPPGFPGRNYQTGGIVAETGLAYVHAGELIIPPMEAQQIASEGGGTTITHGDTNNFNLNVTSVQELTSLMQEFEVMRALAG